MIVPIYTFISVCDVFFIFIFLIISQACDFMFPHLFCFFIFVNSWLLTRYLFLLSFYTFIFILFITYNITYISFIKIFRFEHLSYNIIQHTQYHPKERQIHTLDTTSCEYKKNNFNLQTRKSHWLKTQK